MLPIDIIEVVVGMGLGVIGCGLDNLNYTAFFLPNKVYYNFSTLNEVT